MEEQQGGLCDDNNRVCVNEETLEPKIEEEDEEEEFRSCCEDEDDLKERESSAKEGYCSNCNFDEMNSVTTMYFKGLSICDSNSRLSGIGVIVERSLDDGSPIRIQKKLDFYVDDLVAEYLALLDGLSLVLKNGFKRILAFTDSQVLYNQIISHEEALDNPLPSALRQRILEQSGNLEQFVLKPVPAIELRSSLHLAQVAIGIVYFPHEGELLKETCSICSQEKLSSLMLELKCSHRFCSHCMKTYVERKLQPKSKQVVVPIRCPLSKCKYCISDSEFRLFLPVTSYESLERVLATEENMRKNSDKVINGVVPWHPSMACEEYRDHSASSSEDSLTYTTQQPFEQWSWDSFESLSTVLMDAYSDQERSQLALIQRFLVGGFGSSDDHLQQQPSDHHQSPPRCMDSYADAMKDLHQLPWLERFISVISDDYYYDDLYVR